jgi:hypothetical protein
MPYKPKSGAQRRKERAAKGLPKFSEAELAGRRAADKRRPARRSDHGLDLAKIKQEAGCADCGFTGHPAALHFDHLPGFVKRVNLSQMNRGYARTTVLAEIAKCEVVCANCHAIRTWTRRWGKP